MKYNGDITIPSHKALYVTVYNTKYSERLLPNRLVARRCTSPERDVAVCIR